jgi:hypothetical protein
MKLIDPVLQRVNGLTVVRDDLLEGGSKVRFLPFLIPAGCRELVFGGPFCGGAPWALSVIGRELGIGVTLFYAKRNKLHWRQEAALENGATLFQIPAGRMAVVQHRARSYAAEAGAFFLPLGFDLPAAENPFVAVMEKVAREIGRVPEVWCAAGSGMLARCLGRAFPEARIKAVTVGLASRHGRQAFSSNVELVPCDYRFEQATKASAPFPSCVHYDRKAWELAAKRARPGALFWNVAR